MKAWILLASLLALGQAHARSMQVTSFRIDLENLYTSVGLASEDDAFMDAVGIGAKIQSVFLVGGEQAYQFGFTRPTGSAKTESCVLTAGVDLSLEKVSVLNLDCQEVPAPRSIAMEPFAADETFRTTRVAPTYRSTREIKSLITYVLADKLMLKSNSPTFSRLLGMQKQGDVWTIRFRRQSVGPVCKVSYNVYTRNRPGLVTEPMLWFHRTDSASCSRR